jgi:alpha-tubulin suppressor-like RCC1 family protein
MVRRPRSRTDRGRSRTAALLAAAAVVGTVVAGAFAPAALAASPDPIATQGAIAHGSDHACAITTSSGLRCWGENGQGQLGDGSTTDRDVPVDVVGLTDVVSVSAGSEQTCAVTGDGLAWCWGDGSRGQLGSGTTDSPTPQQVPGVIAVADIATGGIVGSRAHTCAVLASGGVRCWGDGDEGQLGRGSTADATAPVVVSGITDAVAVATGGAQSCALRAGGQVRCWGANDAGQVGNGATGATAKFPSAVVGRSDFDSITAGPSHTCGVTEGRTLWCWGDNSDRQLGTTTIALSRTARQIPGVTGALSASAEGRYDATCVRRATGVWCLGDDGNGATPPTTSAVQVATLDDAIAVGGTWAAGCTITARGSGECIGSDASGQAGNGAGGAPLLTATAVSGGDQFAIGEAVVVWSSAAASTHGQRITLTGVAREVGVDPADLDGTMTFHDEGNLLGTAVVTDGRAGLVTGKIAAGAREITATFQRSGGSYPAVTSAPYVQQVAVASTTTTLTSTANPHRTGQAGVLRAAVKPVAPSTETITVGTVTFSEDGTPFATVPVSSGGASYNVKNLDIGSHDVVATYSGTADYHGSTSAELTQVNQKAATATTVTSPTADPTVFGQPITLHVSTAVLAPGAGPIDAGTITVYRDGVQIASGGATQGGFSFIHTQAPVGDRTFTATYSGSDLYLGSTSAGLERQVDPGPTSTSLTTNVDPATTEQTVTLTATVAPVAPSVVTPSGTVTFLDGTTEIGTRTLNGSGIATLSTGSLTVGDHPITARYDGTANQLTSTSGTVDQTITDPPPPDPGYAITTTSIPIFQQGTARTVQLQATGGGPYTWAIVNGALPAGLTLSSDGKISGTPTALGDLDVTVQATGVTGQASKSFTVTVISADNWTSDRGDAGNRAYAANEKAITPTNATDVVEERTAGAGRPVVYAGVAYVVGPDLASPGTMALRAEDIRDGAVLWARNLGAACTGAGVLASNSFVVANCGDELVTFNRVGDPGSGTSTPAPAGETYQGVVVVGNVLVRWTDTTVQGTWPGSPTWTVPLPTGATKILDVGGSGITAAVAYDDGIRAYGTTTSGGVQLWSRPGLVSPRLAISNGWVYHSDDRGASRIRLSDGTLGWAVAASGEVDRVLGVDVDTVYVLEAPDETPGAGHVVRALKIGDGAQRWQRAATGVVGAFGVTGDLAWFTQSDPDAGDRSGDLVALRRTTGAVLHSVHVADDFTGASAAAFAGNRVFLEYGGSAGGLTRRLGVFGLSPV